ncbi:MAG: hypothetical protein M1499_07925 [Firmicutes bacterium]|jgi:predicted transcriptional regulator|nr:hypothetical protein [Bacillota bacterium]MCL5972471.1 hypothetical protein [Bacillota bacterium]
MSNRKQDRHSPDNVNITIRARRDWITRLDEAAESAGESRMAYIRRAVDLRMAREGIAATPPRE